MIFLIKINVNWYLEKALCTHSIYKNLGERFEKALCTHRTYKIMEKDSFGCLQLPLEQCRKIKNHCKTILENVLCDG
jgi:hypothetical protein